MGNRERKPKDWGLKKKFFDNSLIHALFLKKKFKQFDDCGLTSELVGLIDTRREIKPL